MNELVYIVLSSDLDGDIYIEGVFADDEDAEKFMEDKYKNSRVEEIDYWMETHTVK